MCARARTCVTDRRDYEGQRRRAGVEQEPAEIIKGKKLVQPVSTFSSCSVRFTLQFRLQDDTCVLARGIEGMESAGLGCVTGENAVGVLQF